MSSWAYTEICMPVNQVEIRQQLNIETGIKYNIK